MKIKMLIKIFLLTNIVTSAIACENESEGNIRISNTTKDCINHLGSVFLSNVIVRNKVDVTGNLEGANVSLNGIFMEGRLLLNGRNNVAGNVDIVGELVSANTNFSKKIKINSYNIQLKNGTVTKDILVRKNDKGTTGTQYLYIDNSTVNGNITFESGKGRVILSNGGRYTGALIGGTFENK